MDISFKETLNCANSIKNPNFLDFIIHLITNCYKGAFKIAIMDSQQGKKVQKGGLIVRAEPHDMQLINSEPFFKEAFQRVGFLIFCEKMKRGHVEVAK